MNKASEYWNTRYVQKGHTGWSDYAVYYYDQNLRINALKKIIGENVRNRNNLLDYGCGTGDFSRALSAFFINIIGTDISDEVIRKAQGVNNYNNIKYMPLESENIFEKKFDAILCVTVLQHIINDLDLIATIENFAISLAKDGKIIVLESFAEKEELSDFTRLRNFNDFKKNLAEIGLSMDEVYNFYHPSLAPTELFKNYRGKFITKILNKLVNYNIPGCRFALKILAKYYSRNDVGVIKDDSITKILVFSKNEKYQ